MSDFAIDFDPSHARLPTHEAIEKLAIDPISHDRCWHLAEVMLRLPKRLLLADTVEKLEKKQSHMFSVFCSDIENIRHQDFGVFQQNKP